MSAIPLQEISSGFKMFSSSVIIFMIIYGSTFATDELKLYYYASPTAPVLQLQNSGINAASINNTKQLKVICHGATADINTNWYAPLIDAYLAKGHQIIAVDWGALAFTPEVVSSINFVGGYVGTYLISIHYAFEFPLENIHFIGHSLGAHIGGYAGRLVLQILGTHIGRLTGLDPATDVPLIAFGRRVMTRDDALFVDVIHTMGGTGGIGYSVGKADFYPNGGTWQPGCVNILDLGCSHTRVPWLFIESVGSDGFASKRCDSWIGYMLGLCDGNPGAVMGEGCPESASGGYYLHTNSKSPYAKGSPT